VTIVGGVLVGMNLVAAVEFSFLLGMVTLFAATAYKAWSHGPSMLESFGAPSIAVGFAAACLSAWASVRWMVRFLERHGLALFGFWRVGLAAVVALLMWRGVL
jgi:undecaprenyl-diphosphatase